MPAWAPWLIGLLFGSCLGSFLNVCIYRLPREQSVVKPRSRCPHCRKAIAWYDNVPLLSFFALGGRCRHCRKVIDWRYPLVELLASVASGAVLQRFGLGPAGWIYVAFVAGLIAASIIDLEFQIIPDEISLGGLAVGLLASFAVPALHGTDSHWLSLGRSVIGMLVGGGVLYGTGLLGDLIFRKESMGGGDIKLLAMAGSVVGWKLVLVTFFLAPLLAVGPGLLVLLIKRSHVIPYGPFLSLGLALSLFYGHDALRLSGVEETVRLLWEYRPWFN
ncbi:MAG: prepilin peptidase [Candidatus Omnitrophica bacterium]|nr:prepilin peptidase [Candidatus Omnitrophota bacterium]